MLDEGTFRLLIFGSLLVFLLFAEYIAPRRGNSVVGRGRILSNLLIGILNTLALRFVLPVSAVGIALVAETKDLGLFNQFALSNTLVVLCSIVLLDLVIYWQHRIFHLVPIFWRLHRMHHSDVDLDVTTAIRFHPIEILLSMLLKVGIVLLLGVPLLAVVIFEALLSSCALFNHANIKLPLKVDRWVRALIVTPDMHRVHHSVHNNETNSNYGFCLSVWDRIFSSYTAQPRDSHENMQIGLLGFRSKRLQTVHKLLLQPFVR